MCIRDSFRNRITCILKRKLCIPKQGILLPKTETKYPVSGYKVSVSGYNLYCFGNKSGEALKRPKSRIKQPTMHQKRQGSSSTRASRLQDQDYLAMFRRLDIAGFCAPDPTPIAPQFWGCSRCIISTMLGSALAETLSYSAV